MFAVRNGPRFDVRDPAGKTFLVRDGGLLCTALEWEPGGAALIVDAAARDGPPRRERWRVVPGEPAQQLSVPWPPRREPSGDAAFEIETRRADSVSPPLVYVAPVPSGEPVALESPGPVVRVGGTIVFWRTTTPSRSTRRGTTWMFTPAVLDLWSYDPAARASVRLTTRGFSPRCWDVAITPQASRGR